MESVPQTTLIHLVCGSTGAGKTTYAIALAEKLGGVRFSIDEWMASLFWMDSPQPIESAWAMARVERCMDRIWDTAREVASRGVPCVLDLGLGQRVHREKFALLAKDLGLSLQLHYLEVPAAERWRRVQARNDAKTGTYQLPFDVTREMFDFVEGIFEPPDAAEMAACNGIAIFPQ
ncbi:MAG: ATP-binding protein [Rhizomicrobium sp.]